MTTTKPASSTFKADALTVNVYPTSADLAADIARRAQEYLRDAIATNGSAAVILATGNSQIRFLDQLVDLGGVEWPKITLFHMDEYLGINAGHNGSFRHYLSERVERRVKPGAFHYIEGDALEPIAECERYAALLKAQPIDLCCLGIGDNGHLAFNDPPVADFRDARLVKVVKLDDECREQQVREKHFPDFESVPPYAITLTIPALCSAKRMFCTVPGKHKAKPVRDTLRGPIHTACPASILRRQSHATLFLDADSASLL